MARRTVEIAFNGWLSDALRDKHPHWRKHIQAEQKGVIKGEPLLQPDIVIAPPSSSPVVVETEYKPASTVEMDAVERLGLELASTGQPIEHVFAVRVPSELGSTPQDKIRDGINAAEFEYCIYSLRQDRPPHSRWPLTGWMQGGIDDLATSIEASTLSETLLDKSTNLLEEGIANSATYLLSQPDVGDQIAEKLCQEAGEQTNRMAMAIIANAMVFHSHIEGGQQGIPTLSSLNSRSKLVKEWKRIVHEVNYRPIFRIASDLLDLIPAREASDIIEKLTVMTDDLIRIGARQINDLSGRAFQTLIYDRKFLATFYTLPASATLLAELAISRLDTDWRDEKQVTDLKIADFACGTGALLNAAYHAICSRYRRAGNDDADIHARMIESSLYACDIMPAATHLTLSTLSNAHPRLPYGKTKIATMPYGYKEKTVDCGYYEEGELRGAKPQIGSLELIERQEIESLLSLGRDQLKSKGDAESEDDGNGEQDLDVPGKSMDVIIMNPLYTSPTNHQMTDVPIPCFAGFNTSEDEQKAMSRRLKEINRSLTVKSGKTDKDGRTYKAGSGYAGLSSNFIDLAHVKLKPGGVLAMVLQATFAQGSSWSGARDLLATHYEDITIVSIADTGATNDAFSAETGMGEVLVVARKKQAKSTTKGGGGSICLLTCSTGLPIRLRQLRRPSPLRITERMGLAESSHLAIKTTTEIA